MPVLPEGVAPVKAQHLLNLMEEELSTRFVLVSNAKVYDAYEEAIMRLPEAECTEDNCLALMQQLLEVRLIFTFGVLALKDSVMLALKLSDGPLKLTKNRECAAPCGNREMQAGVAALLAQRRQGMGLAAAPEAGLVAELETLELRESGALGTLSIRLAARPAAPLTLGVSADPAGQVDLQPDTLEFGPADWKTPQAVRVYPRDDADLNGPRPVALHVSVIQSGDPNYGFVAPVTQKLRLVDDDRQGRLRLLSHPAGATVWVDGTVQRDEHGKPLLTPTELFLAQGRHTVTLRLAGHRPEAFALHVRRAKLGTRSVVLEPLAAVAAAPPKPVEPAPEPRQPPARKPAPPPKTTASRDFAVRVFHGSSSSGKASLAQSSLHLGWQDFGAGLSTLRLRRTSASGNRYDLSGRTLDFSYTFGTGWFYTLGLGLPAGGSGSIATSSGSYQSSTMRGGTAFALLGSGWNGFTGWLGYKLLRLKFQDFQQGGTTLGDTLNASGGLLLLGLGRSF